MNQSNNRRINYILGMVLLATLVSLLSKLNSFMEIKSGPPEQLNDTIILSTYQVDTSIIGNPFIREKPVRAGLTKKTSRQLSTNITQLEQGRAGMVDHKPVKMQSDGYLASRACSLFYYAEIRTWSDTAKWKSQKP